jgi:hypothetical protein
MANHVGRIRGPSSNAPLQGLPCQDSDRPSDPNGGRGVTYRKWLRQQLAYLDGLECHELSDYDDVGEVIRDAGRRGGLAGVAAAVKLCDIRKGGLSPAAGRAILAGCLAALPIKQSKERLTPPEVARRLGVSPDTVRKWIATGELAAVNIASPTAKRPRHRIELDALAGFDKRRTAKVVEPSPPRRGRRKLTTTVTRF